MLAALRRRARLKRFGITAGAVWALWVPLLAHPAVRSFLDHHPLIAAAQGPAVATVTLLIGEWGRSRRRRSGRTRTTPVPEGGG